MKFVKQNLFLLVAGLIVVLGSVGMYVMGSSVGAEADQGAQVRQGLSGQLADVDRKAINRSCVDAKKKEVEEAQASYQALADYVLERNRKYPVLTINLPGNKAVPAFPINAQQYADLSLRLHFPSQYKRDLAELLVSVRATNRPSQPEINEEILRVTGKEGPGATPGPGLPPPGAMPSGGDRRAMDIDMGSRGVPAPGRSLMGVPPRTGSGITPTTAPERMETASEKATRALIWSKSQQGWLYADENTSVISAKQLEGSGGELRDDELWMTQVALWVQRDVLEAINCLNQEAQTAAASSKEKGVPLSPIKRLVELNLRGYVVKAGGAAGTAGGGSAAPGADARLTYIGKSLSQGRSTEMTGIPTLTGRACNTLYDVVHYDFKVYLPSRHLRPLYEQLRLRNFHTVLDVKVDELPSTERTGAGASGQALGEYYYGTDNLVQATVVGEMLLLTDWCRGKWDPKAKAYDPAFPPLMPDLFLAMIQKEDASAAREEDKTRTKDIIGTITSTSSGGAAPTGGGGMTAPTGGGGDRRAMDIEMDTLPRPRQ